MALQHLHYNANGLLVILAVILTGQTSHAGFSVAGANGQRSGFTDAPGPLKEPEIAWSYTFGLPGESNTQPVLDAEGNLYVTAAPANRANWRQSYGQPRGVLVSLSAIGLERWRFEWQWDYNDPAWQGSWSQLSGPVITPDGRVVMGFRQGFLRCFDAESGAVHWSRDLSPGWNPITSSPVVDRNGNVYVHCRDIPTIHKIDATGKDVWVHRFVDQEDGHTGSPTLSADERTLYIGRSTDQTSYLYAIDVDDGLLQWAWSPEDSRNHSFSWSIPVAGNDGTIYLQDESLAHLYAIRDLGQVHAHRWSLKREGQDAPRLLAFHDHALYTSYIRESPTIVSVGHDGSERWSRELARGSGVGGLILSGDALYLGLNATGTVYALDPSQGDTIWRKKVGEPHAGFSEGLTMSPEGVLYAPVTSTEAFPDEPAIVALSHGTVQDRGFANRWLICGPFDNRNSIGHDTLYGPELELDFTSTYFGINETLAEWQTNRTPNYETYVAFKDEYPLNDRATAYAVCWARNEGPPKAIDVCLDSDDSLKLYLGDERQWETRGSGPGGTVPHRVPLVLPTGQSVLMVKVSQVGPDWGFRFRVSEPGTNRPPIGIKLSDVPHARN